MVRKIVYRNVTLQFNRTETFRHIYLLFNFLQFLLYLLNILKSQFLILVLISFFHNKYHLLSLAFFSLHKIHNTLNYNTLNSQYIKLKRKFTDKNYVKLTFFITKLKFLYIDVYIHSFVQSSRIHCFTSKHFYFLRKETLFGIWTAH